MTALTPEQAEATARAILLADLMDIDLWSEGMRLNGIPLTDLQAIIRDYLDMREMIGEAERIRFDEDRSNGYIQLEGSEWVAYSFDHLPVKQIAVSASPLEAYKELKKNG